MNLHFLHGFLGLPSDWDQFEKFFLPHQCIKHSIEKFLPDTSQSDNFKTWAQKFNQSIFLPKAEHSKVDISTKNILIGYSLGARLALHSLIENNQWDAAVIISANPGMVDQTEKITRIQNDGKWAQKFLTDSWHSIINEWNSQGVFSNLKNSLIRDESFYDRKKIAHLLNFFSLGKQKNLREDIKNIQIPILWMTGELDEKFVNIGQEMSYLNKNITHYVVENAGHRVPWENSESFKKVFTKWKSQL